MLRYNKPVIILGLLILVAGCARSEEELRAEAEKKANAEINFRNVVGLMEYCAGKGYLDSKLVPKLKADFDDDFEEPTLKTAHQAYALGRKGTLLLRLGQKPGTDGQAADGGEEERPDAGRDDSRIDVTFTRTEQRNGELSVFCKRTELWAAREAAAAGKHSEDADRKIDDR